MNPEQPSPNQKNCITDIPGEVQHIIEAFYDNEYVSYLGHWNTGYMLHWNKSKLSKVTQTSNVFKHGTLSFRNRDGTYPITKIDLQKMCHYVKCVSSNVSHLHCDIAGFTSELLRFRKLQYAHLGKNVPAAAITFLSRMKDLKELHIIIKDDPGYAPAKLMSIEKLACNYKALSYFDKVKEFKNIAPIDGKYVNNIRGHDVEKFSTDCLMRYKLVYPVLSNHVKYLDVQHVYDITKDIIRNSWKHDIEIDYVCNVVCTDDIHAFSNAKYIHTTSKAADYPNNVKELTVPQIDILGLILLKQHVKHEMTIYAEHVNYCLTKDNIYKHANYSNMMYISYKDVTPSYPKNIWNTVRSEYYTVVPKLSIQLYKKLSKKCNIRIVTEMIDCGNITVKLL